MPGGECSELEVFNMRKLILGPLLMLFLGAVPSQPQSVNERQYIGSEACRVCHQEDFEKFKETKMGKIVLNGPRTDLESRGCESCHGPGLAHVESRGDKNLILRFGDHSNVPPEAQEQQCLQCHEKGGRMFWKGSTHESRGLTCVSCHKVMQDNVAPSRFTEPLGDMKKTVQPTKMEVCFECHDQRRAQLQRSSHMPFREGKVIRVIEGLFPGFQDAQGASGQHAALMENLEEGSLVNMRGAG